MSDRPEVFQLTDANPYETAVESSEAQYAPSIHTAMQTPGVHVQEFDGTPRYSYAVGNTDPYQLGIALKSALIAASAGNVRIILGPGEYWMASNDADALWEITGPNTHLIGAVSENAWFLGSAGDELQSWLCPHPFVDPTFEEVLKVSADGCRVISLGIDNKEKVSTGRGYSLKAFKANNFRAIACTVKNNRCTRNNAAYGLYLFECNDAVINQCSARNTGYASYCLINCDRALVWRCFSYEAINRSLLISNHAGREDEWIEVKDFYAEVRALEFDPDPLKNRSPFINLNVHGWYDRISLDNVYLFHAWDSEGYSIDQPNNAWNCLKHHNIRHLSLRDCVFRHGRNRSSYSYNSIMDYHGTSSDPENEDVRTETVEAINCVFSGGISEPGIEPCKKRTYKECTFGLHVSDGFLWYQCVTLNLTVENCVFHTRGVRYVIADSPYLSPDSEWVFSGNRFEFDDDLTCYVWRTRYIVGSNIGIKVKAYDNVFTNKGNGAISPSQTRQGNLLFTTNADGDLLWDENNAATSGIYFTFPDTSQFNTIPENYGFMVNTGWTPGSSYAAEYTYTSGAWRERIQPTGTFLP